MREAIPAKLRFTVFSRDKFRCRYCGRKAPDVELQVDHIVPVSKDGENEIHNYVTACWDCNIGKSNTQLQDHALAKMRPDLLRVTTMPIPWISLLLELPVELALRINEQAKRSEEMNAETPDERRLREFQCDRWEAQFEDADDLEPWEYGE